MDRHPQQIEIAVGSIESGQKHLLSAHKGAQDDVMKNLVMGLLLISDGVKMALQIMPHRIERLHHKIDRVEKKLGSAK